MVKEQYFKNLPFFDIEILEKAYEDLESYNKKKDNKSKKKEKDEITNEETEIYVPGSIYELPYGSFEKEKPLTLKELAPDKFHPMLLFGHYHKNSEETSSTRWFLGTSKLGTVNYKKVEISKNGVEGYVFELLSNAIYDSCKKRKYPLLDTFFLIHPDVLWIYKFNDRPKDRSYCGNIGLERISIVNKKYSEIENKIEPGECNDKQ